MVKREKIVVIGRGTSLEHEICNLGRSLGHEMVSVSQAGRPDVNEPWVSGIVWVRLEDGELGDRLDDLLKDCYAVVLCEHVSGNGFSGDVRSERLRRAEDAYNKVEQVAQSAERAGVSKYVWVRTGQAEQAGLGGAIRDADEVEAFEVIDGIYKEAEDDLLSRAFRATVFRPTVIFGQGMAMEIEQADFVGSMPLEIVAMAALRASLEPETGGIMERDAIELYGDAMMIQ